MPDLEGFLNLLVENPTGMTGYINDELAKKNARYPRCRPLRAKLYRPELIDRALMISVGTENGNHADVIIFCLERVGGEFVSVLGVAPWVAAWPPIVDTTEHEQMAKTVEQEMTMLTDSDMIELREYTRQSVVEEKHARTRTLSGGDYSAYVLAKIEAEIKKRLIPVEAIQKLHKEEQV